MARYMRYLGICFIFFILLLPQHAYSRSFQLLGGTFDIHGFITQESAWRTGVDEDFHNVSDYLTLQAEMGYTPGGILGQYVSFYGIFRFRSDWAYAINRGSDWWKKGGSGLKGSYNHYDEHRLEYSWSSEKNRDLDLPREIYADIYLGNWQFRIGKQQVVWGEADGLRLMDCINAMDWQQEFILRDSDAGYESTRIPVWLIKGEYYFQKQWFNGLVRDHSVEFIIIPRDVETTRFNIGGGVYRDQRNAWRNKYVTTFGDYAGRGGPWAVPYPWLPSFAQARLIEKKKATEPEFAIRFKANVHDWLITLNGYYGHEHNFVLQYVGVTPSRRLGGLLPPVGHQEPFAFDDPRNPHLLQINYDCEYYRRKFVGFTVDKDMVWLRNKWTGETNPVLRVEALYEFSKPFNTMGHNMNGLEWSGVPAYLGGQSHANGIVRRDEVDFMIGYDWPIWIHWLNPAYSFFTSFQYFQFSIIDYGGEELVHAPYVFNRGVTNVTLGQFAANPGVVNKYIDPWRIPKTQRYITYLVKGQYDKDRIEPQVLYVQDLNEDSFWIKAKINFQYGDVWREEVGAFIICADSDADFHQTGKSFGLFAHSDQIYFKITRQFN